MSLPFLLIGTGARGSMWARALAAHPGAHVAALADPDPAARASGAALCPGAAVHADYRAALERGAYAAAILVTPPMGHPEQLHDLAAAGLPVLAEKPLALDLDEATDIVCAFETARLPLSISLNFRYLPVEQELRRWLAENRLGPAQCGLFRYHIWRDGHRPGLNRYPLTLPHTMMLEQTIHHFDLMRFCHGQEVAQIVGRSWNPRGSMYAHDANVNAMLALQDGVEIVYQGLWQSGWRTRGFNWRIDCERGVLLQRGLHDDLAYAGFDDPELIPVPVPAAEPYYDNSFLLLGDFIAALAGGPIPCTGRDHLISLALCFAAIESQETGRVIDMPAYLVRHGVTA